MKDTKALNTFVKPNIMALLLSLAFSGISYAASSAKELPTGGKVVEGKGTINQSGTVMTVNQYTDQMVIDWNTFNIGKSNTVNFVQPASHSVALNRVVSSDVSVIQGKLNANGNIFLINPNGVLFTPTAQVNVGSLVASTQDISNKNFMKGNFTFSGKSTNAIINQGNIVTTNLGLAFIAAKISNQGTIVANKGNVFFGAGTKVTLDLGGPVKLAINRSAIDALIENGGLIRANGGTVYLSASAANKLITTVINNTGVIEARTLATGEKGEINLIGDSTNDRIVVGGKLDVSAPDDEEEGTVTIKAAYIEYATKTQDATKKLKTSTESATETLSATTDAQKSGSESVLIANNRTSIKIQSIEDAPTAAGGDEEEAEENVTKNELVINYLGDGINLPE